MKKIFFWLGISFWIFIGFWAFFGGFNDTFLKDIKFLIILIVIVIFIIVTIALMLKEQDFIKYPFVAALTSAFLTGLLVGRLMFKSIFFISLTIVFFVFIIGWIQFKFQSFSDKTDILQNNNLKEKE